MRLVGIIGMLTAALMVVVGVVLGAMWLVAGEVAAASLMVLYPLMGVLYIVPSVYLLRYATRTRTFLADPHQGHLEAALDAQRSFWKFVGIRTLVGLCVTIVAFVAGFGAAS